MRGSNKVRVVLVSLSLFSEAFTTIRDGRFHAWNPVNKIMTQYFDGGISFRRKCVRHSCLVQGPPDWQTRISRFRVRLSAMIAMTIMRNNYLLMLEIVNLTKRKEFKNAQRKRAVFGTTLVQFTQLYDFLRIEDSLFTECFRIRWLENVDFLASEPKPAKSAFYAKIGLQTHDEDRIRPANDPKITKSCSVP